MNAPAYWQWLADLVLAVHVAIVLFVILGVVLIVLGNAWGWRWVNRLWFRLAHLATILVVVAEAWLGLVCPLTTLEMWLREQAGSRVYAGSFIQYWLQRLLYYEAPDWVFILIYSLFALLVLAVWWRYPPLRR
ncbi:DUF2784 domain-containing protein [Halopseudomonas phragmitis]|uniref:DUF2784 domain-containing protein n=1 Tax=Halopseudomonas phragmitis TaxID=1931241 RepID=A0A1V0B0Z8_9GAMM|nr:DUF2784 domain-containing protein [Halopseudomonas phragmitis]AQZ93606.1 hypothetical protein BVH74_02000 [Halopseudomonas phragmitis]